jgi:regulator of sigma E protease
MAWGEEAPSVWAEKDIDPLRLPFELARVAARKPDRSGWRVQLTVRPSDPAGHDMNTTTTLGPIPWDDRWAFDGEQPYGQTAPVAIPQLGIAYGVENTVVSVAPGSPAARAGIQANDQLHALRVREAGEKLDSDVQWSSQLSIAYPDNKDVDAWGWASLFYELQATDYHEVELEVKRGTAVQPPVKMTAEVDPTSPRAGRGLLLMADTTLKKGDTLLEALRLGVRQTISLTKTMYLSLSRVLSGRISARKSMGGPIEIASQAFTAADDPYILILYLGIISINLAVVNFLPIPVLDGGHMVFLLYEKLRGRRPSEAVQAVATRVGLAVIVLLMITVFGLDIRRRFPDFWRRIFGH